MFIQKDMMDIKASNGNLTNCTLTSINLVDDYCSHGSLICNKYWYIDYLFKTFNQIDHVLGHFLKINL
jgi:hypothetical protein